MNRGSGIVGCGPLEVDGGRFLNLSDIPGVMWSSLSPNLQGVSTPYLEVQPMIV